MTTHFFTTGSNATTVRSGVTFVCIKPLADTPIAGADAVTLSGAAKLLEILATLTSNL